MFCSRYATDVWLSSDWLPVSCYNNDKNNDQTLSPQGGQLFFSGRKVNKYGGRTDVELLMIKKDGFSVDGVYIYSCFRSIIVCHFCWKF